MKKFLLILLVLIILTSGFLYLRKNVISPFIMVGSSMQPTIIEGERLLVNKTYKKFKRGDIVVFTHIRNILSKNNENSSYIKRIIGLPGETVKIENDKVYICNNSSCSELSEKYLTKDTITETRCGNKIEFPINSGYFVLGDNRGFSTDSRCCFGLGCEWPGTRYEVLKEDIIGKVSTIKIQTN